MTIRDVPDTAFMVAAYRAAESARADALFRDPYAARLAGDRGRAIIAALPRGAFFGGWSVAVRTALIDELIAAAVEGGADTVLNLGAGLDARPYRMQLPAALRWVEVDYPHIIELKERKLASDPPRCTLERRKLDLADRDARRALLAKLGAEGSHVLVLAEGVIPYLDAGAVGALADDLHAHPAFRRWIVDYFSPETLRYRRRRAPQRYLANVPFRFAPADWHGFFREHGWAATGEHYLAEEGARRGRPIPLPWSWRMLGAVRGLFTSSAEREAFRRFAGYIVLEPAER